MTSGPTTITNSVVTVQTTEYVSPKARLKLSVPLTSLQNANYHRYRHVHFSCKSQKSSVHSARSAQSVEPICQPSTLFGLQVSEHSNPDIIRHHTFNRFRDLYSEGGWQYRDNIAYYHRDCCYTDIDYRTTMRRLSLR
jgi:hypothetical protein